MNFRGAARPLTTADVKNASKLLRVPEHVIWALRKVESAGKAFSKDGRPIIAYEAHIFYKQLPTSKRAHAVAAKLAHERWKGIPYLFPQESRYQQLERAARLDLDAALKSCSWGAYQIMGFNYERCGFKDVVSFVQAMTESEGEQLLAVAKFIKSDKQMHQALKKNDWHSFARRYNGPGYTQNRYVEKLMHWVAHYKGQRMETETARIEREPSDPAGAKQETREAMRDGGKTLVGLTALIAMISEWFASLHVALDEAVKKLTGIKGMADWVEPTLVVLVSISALSLVIHMMKRQRAKKENANV